MTQYPRARSIRKSRARLERVYERIEERWPASAGFLRWVRRPSLVLLRIPIAVLLLFGGVLSFLPILGIWMLPLGLMLLAVDFPPLQTPVAWVIIKGQRRWQLRRRRRAGAVRKTA